MRNRVRMCDRATRPRLAKTRRPEMKCDAGDEGRTRRDDAGGAR